MTEGITTNLYPCAHCEQTGTCKNGKDGKSCPVCIKDNEIKGKEHIGLICASCGGIGQAEPRTERMNKRAKPLLAMFIVMFMLIVVSALAFTNNENFKDILAFSGLLIGSITGYYFSSNKTSNT